MKRKSIHIFNKLYAKCIINLQNIVYNILYLKYRKTRYIFINKLSDLLEWYKEKHCAHNII